MKEATIQIQLPRRSLLVQFTCDACYERTSRLISRIAYERGTVFLQVPFLFLWFMLKIFTLFNRVSFSADTYWYLCVASFFNLLEKSRLSFISAINHE